MVETGNTDPEELPDLRDLRVRGRSLRTWMIGGAVVLLAISAAFGGLKKAADDTPQVAVGTAIDAGWFEVTVERVVVVKDLKPLITPDEGGTLIAVVAKVKLTDDTGVTPDSALIRLIGVPGIKDTDPPIGTTDRLVTTASKVLTPQYDVEVAYVWKLPKATKRPAEVKLTVQHYEHIADSGLDHHEKWDADRTAAESTVAVKDNTR